MAITSDFTITFDTDVRVPFVIYDGDGLTDDELQAQIDAGTAQRKDLSGKTIAFYMRKKVNSVDPPLIYKTSASSPSDIELTGTAGGSPDQVLWITFHDTDVYDPTASPPVAIKPAKYPYAVKILDAGEEAVIGRGITTVEQTAAWE